ncbi:MAG: alpha/beta fold hydrolase [Saprospiraceae bacterium]|nr:alpha/beta fold hydrolase [Saprospiraceae bacterium]
MPDNRVLNHKIYGEGQPVYIFHGLFGMLDNWYSFAKVLSEEFQVITADLRNHGRSFHDDDHSYQAMAEDIISLMDHLGHDQAVLMGHSMGGKAVAQLALDHPERVVGLIVVDILPIDYERGHDAVLEALNALDIDKTDSRSELKKDMTDLLGGDTGVANFLLKSLKRKDDKGFSWQFNLDVLTEKYDDIRRPPESEDTFEGATLFIKGGLSNYVGMSGWMDTTELFPNADLKEIDDAGHWVHVDQPDRLLEVVKDFIRATNG